MSFSYSVWWNGKYTRSTSTFRSTLVVLRRGACAIAWIACWARTSLFFVELSFYLEEWLTDKGWLSRLQYLAEICLKKNQVSLLFQGKQSTVFVTNDKILFLKQNLKFWKTFIHYHDCGRFLVVKYFSNETHGDISKCDFFLILYKKCVNIWHICITQWTIIFQMTSTWCYKIMCG